MNATNPVFPDLPDPLPRHLSCGFYRITPERAGRVLDESKRKNRAWVSVKLRRLTRDMAAGRWQLNGESAIFTWDGDCQDAHHRLESCRLSGVPITLLCAFGLDPATFPTIDTGANRTGTGRLSIAGEKNANKLAAVLRLIWAWANDRAPVTTGVSALLYGPEEEALILELYPEARKAVVDGGNYYHTFDTLPVSQWSFLSFVTHHTAPDLARAFLDRLADGVGLSAHSPVLMLRQRLINGSKGKMVLPAVEVMALCAKAWAAHREGRSLRSLRWESDDGFPTWGPPAEGKGAFA